MKRRPVEIPYIPKHRRGSRFAPRGGGKILSGNKGVEALRETNADAWGKRDKKAQNGCGLLFFFIVVGVMFGGEAGEGVLDKLLGSRTELSNPAPSPEGVSVAEREEDPSPPVADLAPPLPTFAPFTPPVGRLADLFSTDDYPVAELAAGVEGVVRANLVVGTDGRVEDCRILASSGSDALDARTCEIFVARARFEPARDVDGNALRAAIDAPPVAWRIPQ